MERLITSLASKKASLSLAAALSAPSAGVTASASAAARAARENSERAQVGRVIRVPHVWGHPPGRLPRLGPYVSVYVNASGDATRIRPSTRRSAAGRGF